jgi:hypothetical protein
MSGRDGHKITAKSRKDGSPWFNAKGEEWQRWWCGVDHGDGRKCSVSIPKATGKKAGGKR